MAIHYFHCTNGIDMVINGTERDVATGDEMPIQARAVAAEAHPGGARLSRMVNWSVHVYDAFGAVAIVDFPTDRRRAA